MKLIKFKCKWCNWEWTPRVEKPKVCPNCQKKKWDEK